MNTTSSWWLGLVLGVTWGTLDVSKIPNKSSKDRHVLSTYVCFNSWSWNDLFALSVFTKWRKTTFSHCQSIWFLVLVRLRYLIDLLDFVESTLCLRDPGSTQKKNTCFFCQIPTIIHTYPSWSWSFCQQTADFQLNLESDMAKIMFLAILCDQSEWFSDPFKG